VHGLAVSIELNWGINGIVDALSTRYRVVALDLRGHGRSGKPREDTAYGTRLVQDLVNLLDHLRIDRAHIVGYSLGAAITTKFLVEHPERVVSAVLGGGGWIRRGMTRPAELRGWLAGFERAARDGTPVFEVMRQPDWPEFPPQIVALVNQNDPAALAALVRSDSGLVVAESDLRASRVPVLAVVGAHDASALSIVDTMRTVMSNLRVQILPDVNHLTAINHPAFLQSILEFLRTRSGTDAAPALARSGLGAGSTP
jgi:pimeloyl-ACP methyl ester carboxylesterase